MTYDPDIHYRRSIRLQGFDYASANAYFVTLCVQDRECLFGDIVDGDMRVNDAGRVVDKWWTKLPEKFAGVSLDEVVIMPNHFHGIVVLGAVGADPCVCPVFPGSRSPASSDQIINKGAHGSAPTADCAMVQDNDHQRIYPLRQKAWLAIFSRPFMATELLRADHPQRE